MARILFLALAGLVCAGLLAAPVAGRPDVSPGKIDLVAEEQAGGHTIARHVGKSEAALMARLANDPTIPAAGSFATRAEAERFVADAIRVQAGRVAQWADDPTARAVLRLDHRASLPVGITVIRGQDGARQTTRLRVILRKRNSDDRRWFVLTAFPTP